MIIIGAGISGATCAYRLEKYGFKNILVLEAESQVGGRILSIDTSNKSRSKNNIVELGARWIHNVCSNNKHLTLSMAKEAGVKWNTVKESVEYYMYNMIDDCNIKLPSDLLKNEKYKNSIISDALSIDDDGFPQAYLENDRYLSDRRKKVVQKLNQKNIMIYSLLMDILNSCMHF